LQQLLTAEGPSSIEERGRRRFRRINLTAAASIGFRGAVMLAGFIYIPLTVQYLGKERYGLWVAMVSIMTLLAFADCGIGYGLMNHVAYALGRGATDAIRRSLSSTFFALCGIAVSGSLLFMAASPFVPWQTVFRTSTPEAAMEAGRAVAVMVYCYFATLPFTTVQRVQAAYQAGFENQLWEIGGVGFSLFGLLAAIRMHASLPVLAVIFSLGPLTALALNWLVYFFFRHPELAPSIRLADLRLARKIMSDGGWFFILQIAFVLIVSTDSFVILHYYGESALGEYNLAAKLFQTLPAVAGVWFAPLWPAYAEAIARNDLAWVRKTLFRSTLVGLTVCTAAAGVLAFVTRPVVKLWTGAAIDPSTWVISGLAVYAVLAVGTGAVSAFLNAYNCMRGQAKIVFAHTVVSVILKVVLCRAWNISGAVWSTNIGYLVIVIPAYFVLVPRLGALRIAAPRSANAA
jgi:O-antigen/teichoic acid export membrane protein